jgi:hypothetical protein
MFIELDMGVLAYKPRVERQRQKVGKFEARLGYIVRPYFKILKIKNKKF